jgi:heterodisulfide reductase subunit B
VTHDRCYWVVDCEREQWTLPQQVEKIITKHQEFSLLASHVEANSYQAGLLEAIEQKMRETNIALTVAPHYTNKTNKPDPELGVQAMAPWFERGAFHIPQADAFSQNRMRQLVEELVMYPDSRTTDTVMALWFAWRALQSTGQRFASVNRMAREAPRLNKRFGSRRLVMNPAYRGQGEAA